MKTKKDTHAHRLTARSPDGNHGKLALGQAQPPALAIHYDRHKHHQQQRG
jgi:hypothetical protein